MLRQEARLNQNQMQQMHMLREEQSAIYDPLATVSKTQSFINSLQPPSPNSIASNRQQPIAMMNTDATIDQLLQPNQSNRLPLQIRSSSENKSNLAYRSSRARTNISRNAQPAGLMTLQPCSEVQEPVRPQTQQQGRSQRGRSALNKFFTGNQPQNIKKRNVVTPGNASSQMSRYRGGATSTMISENDQEAGDGANTSLKQYGQYRPMLSGALSPNQRTGKVQVNYDQSSMSIIVIKDAVEDQNQMQLVNKSELSGQSVQLRSYLQSLQRPKEKGIAYGGRGPRSNLQNRIGLGKTTGYTQFAPQYFEYPVHLTQSNRESVSKTISALNMQEKMRNLRTAQTQRDDPALNMNYQVGKAFDAAQLQDTSRATPDLYIEGTPHSILTVDQRRSPTSRRENQNQAIFALVEREQPEYNMVANYSRSRENTNNSNRTTIMSQLQNQVQQQKPNKVNEKEPAAKDDGISPTECRSDDEYQIKRDSTLDLAGFTAYLNRTKAHEDNGDSRRDTELLRLGTDQTPKAGTNQISLNIKAVIETKNGTNQVGVVNELSSTLEVPEAPKLIKTQTLLL